MSLKESIQNKLSGRFTLAKVAYLRLKYIFMPADPEFKKLKNTHKGEKCYVVALGPSLTVEDLNLLKEHRAVCFSVNGIFGLFDQTDWRPDYYFMSDEFDDGSEKSREFLSHLEEKLKDVPYCFYNMIYYPDKYVRKAIGYKANVVRNVLAASRSSFWRKRNYYCKFSTNAARFVYDGSTCIQSVIQIAYYLGFSEVYLLGTDCSLSGGQHHAAGADNTVADTEEAIEAEQNCYNNYIRDYDYLYRDMQRKHISMKIYNATRGGNLEVFPRVKLEDSFG